MRKCKSLKNYPLESQTDKLFYTYSLDELYSRKLSWGRKKEIFSPTKEREKSSIQY